jgi:glucokinase
MQPRMTTPRRDEPYRPLPPAHALAFDVGGTKMAAGVVSADGKLADQQVMPTPSYDQMQVLDAILRTAAKLRELHPGAKAIGVGAAGWVEWPVGRIRYAPYIAYDDMPLRQLLEESTGLPVVIDNDANMAAWAESRFGAGKGVSNMLLLTLGTGIGGGLIIGGEIYRGHNGLGGEVGHLIVSPGGERCGCGNRGCFETMASGTALVREARKAVVGDAAAYLVTLAGSPEAVTGETVTRAAKAGDRLSAELLHQAAYWCGLGAASLVAVLDPALIVVTGGLAAAGELLLEPMRESLAEHLFARGRRHPPPIAVSQLGLNGGLIGAGSLALHAAAGRRS